MFSWYLWYKKNMSELWNQFPALSFKNPWNFLSDRRANEVTPGGSQESFRTGAGHQKGQPHSSRLELWASHLWGGQGPACAASPRSAGPWAWSLKRALLVGRSALTHGSWESTGVDRIELQDDAYLASEQHRASLFPKHLFFFFLKCTGQY